LQSDWCKTYSYIEVFEFNYFVWTLGFMVGLNFTHFDQGPMTHFMLDPDVMKTWGSLLWSIFVLMIALLVGVFWRIFIEYSSVGIL
jgi:uncharacterized membrane protein SpoIIM required for sporulation